jgi:hypothetical protein
MYPRKIYTVSSNLTGEQWDYYNLREAKAHAKKVAKLDPEKIAFIDITIEYSENDYGEGIVGDIKIKA